jgi:hypothetical protein
MQPGASKGRRVAECGGGSVAGIPDQASHVLALSTFSSILLCWKTINDGEVNSSLV